MANAYNTVKFYPRGLVSQDRYHAHHNMWFENPWLPQNHWMKKPPCNTYGRPNIHGFAYPVANPRCRNQFPRWSQIRRNNHHKSSQKQNRDSKRRIQYLFHKGLLSNLPYAEEEIFDHLQTNHSLETNTNKVVEENKFLQNKYNQVKEKLEATEDAVLMTKKLTEENTSLKDTCVQLKANLEQTSNANNVLKDALESAKADNTMLRRKVNDLENLVRELQITRRIQTNETPSQNATTASSEFSSITSLNDIPNSRDYPPLNRYSQYLITVNILRAENPLGPGQDAFGQIENVSDFQAWISSLNIVHQSIMGLMIRFKDYRLFAKAGTKFYQVSLQKDSLLYIINNVRKLKSHHDKFDLELLCVKSL